MKLCVFDPNAVGFRWFKQTDLSMVGLVKVALDILQDWEEDGGDSEEDGEENPVELVEKSQVGSTLENKAAVSVSDEKEPRREVNI